MERQVQRTTRRIIWLILTVGLALIMLLVARPGWATVAQRQTATATPAGEATSSLTPNEEMTGAPAEEATPSPAPEEEATATPAEEATASPAPEEEVTATSAPEEESIPQQTPTPTPASSLTDEELLEQGQALYTDNCAACHQADGQGIYRAYPALAGNGFVTAEDPAGVIRVIYTGRAGMPHFRDAITDQEIASVISYIRNGWGNSASTVSLEQVRDVEEMIYSPSEAREHSGDTE